tara:strand:+ start:2164 stop:2505 length:342 start_codon:yes stop_codon:yes gene_type:complete
MVKIEIVKSLFEEIEKKFKRDASKVYGLMDSLKNNPKKGKLLGSVGGIVIKELKFKKFRFYFITDGFKLKYLREEDLVDLLLRFIRMSDKKEQQKIINEIKHTLQTLGPKSFT